jgi:hypothetical protein
MRDLLYRIVGWDFVRMGKGIETRHKRCADYWAPHISCTKNFITKHVTPGGKIAILGAGRLLDVDLSALIPLFQEIHLYDADPTAASAWKRVSGSAYGRTVFGHIEDITNSLSEWTSGLSKATKKGGLADYLAHLVVRPAEWESQGFDGVISLNIIGQLPLYWRDRVLELSDALSREEECALVDSMARLQTAHVKSLQISPRSWAIAITDTEYYSYQVDYPEWEVTDALHGSTRDLLNRAEPATIVIEQDTWLWHLAPQFVESDTEGAIHRVEARAWRRTQATCSDLSR